MIVGGGLLAYQIFSNAVRGVTGDPQYLNYLSQNRVKILSGEVPFDRPTKTTS